jgi:hypothetical protein
MKNNLNRGILNEIHKKDAEFINEQFAKATHLLQHGAGIAGWEPSSDEVTEAIAYQTCAGERAMHVKEAMGEDWFEEWVKENLQRGMPDINNIIKWYQGYENFINRTNKPNLVKEFLTTKSLTQ